MRRSTLPALPMAVLALGCGESPQEELEGAWQVVEVSFTSPDTSWTNSSPQPGLYVFSETHYSLMIVPGTEVRALYDDGNWPASGPPTDEEKVMMYDTFIANSGRFEVADGTITARPMVAKNTNFMAKGSWTAAYELNEDTLVLIGRDDSGGETRTTLRQLEE